jgi:hypothetical protein
VRGSASDTLGCSTGAAHTCVDRRQPWNECGGAQCARGEARRCGRRLSAAVSSRAARESQWGCRAVRWGRRPRRAWCLVHVRGKAVPAQMWQGRAPVPAQTRQGRAQVPAQMWQGRAQVPVQMAIRARRGQEAHASFGGQRTGAVPLFKTTQSGSVRFGNSSVASACVCCEWHLRVLVYQHCRRPARPCMVRMPTIRTSECNDRDRRTGRDCREYQRRRRHC